MGQGEPSSVTGPLKKPLFADPMSAVPRTIVPSSGSPSTMKLLTSPLIVPRSFTPPKSALSSTEAPKYPMSVEPATLSFQEYTPIARPFWNTQIFIVTI